MGLSKSKSTSTDEEAAQETIPTNQETQQNEQVKTFFQRLWEFITFSAFFTSDVPNLVEDPCAPTDNLQTTSLSVDGSDSTKTKKKLKRKKEKVKKEKTSKSCLAIVHIRKKTNGNKLLIVEADSQTPKPSEDKETCTSSLFKCWHTPNQKLPKTEKVNDDKEIIEIYSDKNNFEEDSSESSATSFSRRLVYLWPPWGSKEVKSDTDAAVKIHKLQLKEHQVSSKASTSKSGKAVKFREPTVHQPARIKFSPKVSLVAFDNTDAITSDDKKESFRELVKKERRELLLVDSSDECLATKLSRTSKRTYVQSHVKKTVKRANLELFKSEDLQFEN